MMSKQHTSASEWTTTHSQKLFKYQIQPETLSLKFWTMIQVVVQQWMRSWCIHGLIMKGQSLEPCLHQLLLVHLHILTSGSSKTQMELQKMQITIQVLTMLWDLTLLMPIKVVEMIISKILTASIKQHNLEMIEEESSRQEKPRYGSRSGLTIPPNMVWDTIYRMTQLECSSTTPPK